MKPTNQIRLFEMRPDPSAWANYRMTGKHPCGVPSIECSICLERWIQPGLDHPCLDLTGAALLQRYFEKNPLLSEEFTDLCAELYRVIGREILVKPGSSFGPLYGKIVGTPAAIAFTLDGCPFLTASAYSELQKSGVRGIVGAQAVLKSRNKKVEPLFELQIEAHAWFAQRSLPPDGAPPCPGCGLRNLWLPEMWWVKQSSLPEGLDLFRLVEIPSVKLVTARFVEAVKRLKLTGAVFEPVNIDPS